MASHANKVKFYIGDVRNPQSIADAMPGVDYIFHAAALKQVPSCEFFPMEAVRTNVEGTDNLLHAAIANGVKRVVCLSTDKAAYPINAMGISKAMMEHVITANARVAAERVRSEDMGSYYRVSADNRDLNYDKYFVKGHVQTQADEAYTSHNTTLLDVDGTVKKLLTTDYVNEALKEMQ